MAVFAVALSFTVAIVFSAAIVLAYRQHKRLIARLDSLENPSDAFVSRYVVPHEVPATVTMPPEVDVVGAWAIEQERAGIEVSDEELSTQRRMWAEYGV